MDLFLVFTGELDLQVCPMDAPLVEAMLCEALAEQVVLEVFAEVLVEVLMHVAGSAEEHLPWPVEEKEEEEEEEEVEKKE